MDSSNVVYMRKGSDDYTHSCIFRRNQYMVSNANLLLAAYDGQPGGTGKCGECEEYWSA